MMRTRFNNFHELLAIFTMALMLFLPGCGDDGTNYENLSPNPPSSPIPDNGAVNQPLEMELVWSCSDPDGDPLTYEIFFGENGNPPPVAFGQSDTTYNPGQLQNNTTYYWKIKAYDLRISRTGPIWNFTTESQ